MVINVYAVAEVSCLNTCFRVCSVPAVPHKSRASTARDRMNFLIYEFCVPSNILGSTFLMPVCDSDIYTIIQNINALFN